MIHEDSAQDQQLLELLRPIWRAASQTPVPPPRAMARVRALYQPSQVQPRRATWSPTRLRLLVLPRRFAAVTIALVLFLLLALSGGVAVAVAAQPALPGESLYPAKTTVEQLRLAVTGSEAGRAELHLEFAQSRVDEILALTVRGRYDWIPATAAAYESEARQASTELAAAARRNGTEVEPLAQRAETSMERFSTALASVAGTAPREPQQALEHAVGVSATVKQEVTGVILVITRNTPTPTPPLVPSGTSTLLPTDTPMSVSTPTETALAPTETPTAEPVTTPTAGSVATPTPFPSSEIGTPTIPPTEEPDQWSEGTPTATGTPNTPVEIEPPGPTGTPVPTGAWPPTDTPVPPSTPVPTQPPAPTDTPVPPTLVPPQPPAPTDTPEPPDTPQPTKTKPHPPPSPPPPTRKPTNTPKAHPNR